MANSGSDKTRHFSSLVVDGMERAPSRAMLHVNEHEIARRFDSAALYTRLSVSAR